MPKTFLEELLRKRVVVRANGIIYTGILLEVGPDQITLRRETGYATIPMDRITSVSDPNKNQKKENLKHIHPSFYSADLTPKKK